MTVTHEDLRQGRLNVYKLTGSEAQDIVDEYDAVVAERDRLRAKNEKLRACLAELAGAGVEYDAGKYVVVQVHHETLEEANKLLGRE